MDVGFQGNGAIKDVGYCGFNEINLFDEQFLRLMVTNNEMKCYVNEMLNVNRNVILQ